MMMMQMFFYVSEQATILFENWETATWAEMLGSCVAVAVLAILYEGLKLARELVDKRMKGRSVATGNSCDCECPDRDTVSQVTDNSGGAVMPTMTGSKVSSTSKHPILQPSHLVQTLLYFVQIWVSMLLMLVFMTYNVYLCLAVSVGGAIGYFCFAWASRRTPGREIAICH